MGKKLAGVELWINTSGGWSQVIDSTGTYLGSVKAKGSAPSVIVRETDDGNDAVKLSSDGSSGILEVKASGNTYFYYNYWNDAHLLLYTGKYFGIQTTTPKAMLHVVGDVTIAGVIKTGGDGSTAGTTRLDASGNATLAKVNGLTLTPVHGASDTITLDWSLYPASLVITGTSAISGTNTGDQTLAQLTGGNVQYGTAATNTQSFVGRLIPRTITTGSNPSADVAGTTGEIAWCSTDSKHYACYVGGNAGSALWTAIY